MTWENKTEMIRLLNNEKYEEAVDFFRKENDWDDQAVEMFVLGFNLTKSELLNPIKERIVNVTSPDFRTAFRLAIIQEELEKWN